MRERSAAVATMPPRVLLALALTAAAAAVAAAAVAPDTDFTYTITDEQYYSMPRLFELDDWAGCAGRRQHYCLGSFELAPQPPGAPHRLFDMMQRYSSNWVERFNHTRLHRGVCVEASCAALEPPRSASPPHDQPVLQAWFERCVNETTWSAYNLSARLYTVGCQGGAGEPAGGSARALLATAAALLALAALSTALDLTLADHAKKGYQWALAWSLRGCWAELLAQPPAPPPAAPGAGAGPDLRAFDGLRVLCMMCVIVEHVCWLGTLAYGADPRFLELNRYKTEVMLLTNSTLVVQVFFMMSSFLLARKLLRTRTTGFRAFFSMMFDRIVRISPAYWAVVWLMASGWQRLGAGPQWPELVESEAAICRKKWWTHLLYLNNIIYPDDKCLIQTWYLAADMQLYAVSLALMLVLGRWRRLLLPVLSALLVGSVSLLAALAYAWRLVPTFIMHHPENVRDSYNGSWSFNVLYQSPLGNVPGALAGLLLAALDQTLRDHKLQPNNNRWFRWASVAACPLAFWWVAWSPRLVGRGRPDRAAAAAMAALERPIFASFVGLAILGAMHHVQSPWQRVMAWRGWRVWSRLSFAALLLHLPLNKALLAARLAPAQQDHAAVVLDWLGVASASYLLALPLCLLLELPCLRLHRALTARAAPAAPAAPRPPNKAEQGQG